MARWFQKMLKYSCFVPHVAALLAITLSVGCGTTTAGGDDGDALFFQPPDAKGDVPVVKADVQDTLVTDVALDVPDGVPDGVGDFYETAIDAETDTIDAQDSGPTDVYVPECVTDTTCDDQNLCTVDLCANDTCKHTPIPGCCLQESDCPKAPTCKSAQCVSNTCVNVPVENCCASGVCCDPVKQTTKVAQAPCDVVPIGFEFDCQGSDVWGRKAIQGCDGKQTAACSGNTANYSWTDWGIIGSCPGGSFCQKNPDKTVFPLCSGTPAPAPSCVDAIGCYDADPCTLDACTNGTCTHALADATALCGTTSVFTQYDCLNGPGGTQAGGSIVTRSQYASCGSAGKCDGKAVWSPWTITTDCLATEKCDVPISTEPGTCALISVCKPGTTCCGADGQYAATGTACGTAVVATEYQCETTGKGSKYTVHDGVAGCSGASALCSAATPSWGNWKAAGTCGYNQLCSLPLADAPPVCTDVCVAGTTCCTGGGDWADQGSKCADALIKSVSKCTSANGVESVMSAQVFPGCTGVDETCSIEPANLNKSAYTLVKQCQSYEKCVQNGDLADCQLNAPCQPGTQCCTADGQFAPLASPCLSTNQQQFSCSNNLPGGAVQVRDVFLGCSGVSTQCSYSPTNYYFSPWVDQTECLPTEACSSPDLTVAECVSLQQCTPGSICCDGNGKFMLQGTKCGPPDVIKTEYKCDGTALGGSILKKESYAACVGTAANCSKLDADLVWEPAVWLTKQSCGPMNYCHVSGPTDPGLCNNTPP